jgi:copper(I)-binding protein
MWKLVSAAAAALCLSLLPARAFAHGFTLGDLAIGHPWSMPVMSGALSGAGYLMITNNGKTADRLIAVETTDADRVYIDQTVTQDGMMRMVPVKDGVEIAPGKTIVFAPGGYHLMLVKPKRAFAVGEHIYMTLRFQHAGSANADFVVQAAPPNFAPHH